MLSKITTTTLLMAFAFTMCSLIAQASLQESLTNIESLIQNKKYAQACRVTRYLGYTLGYEQAINAMIEKAKFFASLEINPNDEENEFFNFELEDLVRTNIAHLSETSPEGTIQFVNEIVPLIVNKWPTITGLILEDFYGNFPQSLDLIAPILSAYLCPNQTNNVRLIFEKMEALYMTVHNLLANYLQAPGRIEYFAEHGNEVLKASILGQQCVVYFLTEGYDLLKATINIHYQKTGPNEIKSMFLPHINDTDDTIPAKQDLYHALVADNKEKVSQAILESFALTHALGTALSTALFMKKNDGIAYLKSVYSSIIEMGHSNVAEKFKNYILKQPMTEKDLYQNYIPNPSHVLSKELIKLPDYFKQAFA